MKKINLLAIYTNSYEEIYKKYFLKTLPNEFDSVTVEHILNFDSNPGSVGEFNFKNINFKKLNLIYKNIKANLGEILIVSDLDIIFFKEFKEDVLNLLQENDILLQDNGNKEYNVGFITIKCTDKVVKFFEEIVIPMSKEILEGAEISDQGVLNRSLNLSTLRHGYLPKRYWANRIPFNVSGVYGTNLNQCIESIPHDAVLLHAVAIDGGAEIKKLFFEEVFKQRG